MLEIIQASFTGRIIMNAKYERKMSPLWKCRLVDPLQTNYLFLDAPKSMHAVHAGRIYFAVLWKSPFQIHGY